MIILLAILCLLLKGVATELNIASFTGTIGPGNYTYFTLNEKGRVTLILESLSGDVDIYLSKDVEKPNYAEYDLQSATCGLDKISVPKSYPRPLHIALYGYIQSTVSEYKLTVVKDATAGYDQNNFDKYTPTDNEGEDKQSLKSILWTIILGILKIILEVVF